MTTNDQHRVVEEHRCFCRHTPLLGCVIKTKDNKYKYHVRVFKAGRIYGEVFLVDGAIEVTCRDCLRVHKVRIIKNRPVMESAP